MIGTKDEGGPINQNKVNLAHAIATLLNFTPFLIGVLNDHQDELRNKIELNEETFNDYSQEDIADIEYEIDQCRHIATVFQTLNRQGDYSTAKWMLAYFLARNDSLFSNTWSQKAYLCHVRHTSTNRL